MLVGAKVVITALVLTACAFASLAILDRFENPTNEFATYQELAGSGLMQAGWIPKGIPHSAFEISETHNLDTNIVHISFRFTPGDISAAEELCQPAQLDKAEHVFTCGDGILTLSADGAGYFTNAKD